MATLIYDRVLPRLIAAHLPLSPEVQPEPAGRTADRPVGGGCDPRTFAEVALGEDAGALLDRIDSVLDSGASVETLLVEIMAPAARMLGERWKEDSADFIDVTIGLWRLQEMIHILAARRNDTLILGSGERIGRRILCATPPGEEHSFGSVMLEEVFQRNGWTASGLRGGTESDLNAMVTRNSYDVVALTVSTYTDSATLANLLASLRSSSRNRGVSIMVGGYVFNEHPDWRM